MFNLNHKGQSLPIVLGVTALILANTYYFLSVNKTSSDRAKAAQTTIEGQTEQARISSYLADINNCAKQISGAGIFYGRNLAALTDRTTGMTFDLVSSPASGSQTYLKVGNRYAKKTLAVKKYYLQADTSITQGNANNEVGYYLVVEYDLKNPNDVPPYSPATDLPVNNPREVTVTKVPLIIQKDGAGNIVNCYARPSTAADSVAGTSSMATAVANACRTPTPIADPPGDTNTAYLDTTTSAAIATCNHRVTPTTCGPGMVINSAAINQVDPNKYSQDFTCAALITTACGQTPNETVLNGVINSVGQCASPQSCPAGSLLVKNGATTSCTTNCNIGVGANPPIYQLHNGINSSGTPTCIDLGRVNTCPAGQYALSVNASGVPTCEYIKYRNVACPASNFATDMDPVNGLACQYFNRTKDCAGSNNFIANFTGVPTSCKNFTF